ncbi:diacylglycerol kinase [Pseudoalteromonas citrea]|uniref:Diacylglycerol kinase n=1 Tax=Pseudoalteromonas citrea TaxID=43655 RepID=A0A5S3XN27_9GAMM|nr:YegS/Rv2252/BmrU family lipid kinase [Pseudoalteromonas citrea]TMP43754.1 diacylglycerol kinase [Pseudoalteromonas citrea]TMP55305.1 diacylglycerol kinase [Pseudoalteromonas citrea]
MLVVVKPCSSKSSQSHVKWLKGQFAKKNIANEWFFTSGRFAEDVAQIRSQCVGQATVVVIGGDGTLHLVINAMIGQPCNLALLPAGTGNDFARQFKLSMAQWRACVFTGTEQAVDVGMVNGRYFINMLGIGFSAHVVRTMQSQQKRGQFSYIWAGLLNLFNYRNVRLATSSAPSRSMMMLLIANGQYFAAGLKCAPTAQYQSGELVGMHFYGESFLARLKTFTYMLFAQHMRLSSVIKTAGTHFMIHTGGLDIEADGEIIGQTPAKINCCPDAIRLKQPANCSVDMHEVGEK